MIYQYSLKHTKGEGFTDPVLGCDTEEGVFYGLPDCSDVKAFTLRLGDNMCWMWNSKIYGSNGWDMDNAPILSDPEYHKRHCLFPKGSVIVFTQDVI